MIIDELVSRLDKVKQTGPGNWIACCPSHDDRQPSMTIRETDEGVILIHCFAGCGLPSILSAVGMDATDLFPDRPITHFSPPLRNRFPARDVLECVANEALIVSLVAIAVRDGKPIPAEDVTRCTLAYRRITEAIDAIG